MLGPERKIRSEPEFPALSSPTLPFRPAPSGEDGKPRLSVARSSEPGPASSDAPVLDGAPDDKSAAKQALAANLEGMIEGMLRNNRFATAPTTKTRGVEPTDEVAVAATAGGTDFTANSLIADLAQARPPGPEDEKRRRTSGKRWWIDVVLVLACLLSVASAGYFTFGQ
jgi:hypothetical protein